MKKIIMYDGMSLMIIGAVGAILSLLLYDLIWRVIIIFIGLILLLWGISYLMFTLNARNYKQENVIKPAIKSILLITVGASLLVPWTSWIVQFVVGLAVGLYLLGTCLYRLVEAEDKKMQFKKDSLKYIISLLVIVLGIQDSGKYVAVTFFTVIFICGIISLITEKRKNFNFKQKNDNEISDIEYYVDDNQE